MLHRHNKDIVFCGIAKATVPNYFLHEYLMRAHPANGASVICTLVAVQSTFRVS